MRCPVDNETLVMADRNGVEIDYCPKCRGVWLDRGELDKIIERAAGDAPAARPAAAAPPPPAYQPDPRMAPPPPPAYGQRPYRHDDDDDDEYKYRGSKKKSFLKDIFDF